MAVATHCDQAANATRCAFDAVAATYDGANRSNAVLEAMRQRSLRTLFAAVPAGSHVLDLGCGPGTDFAAMLSAGYAVTALESSPVMAKHARRRAHELAAMGTVDVQELAIEKIGELTPAVFDAAYSSFGPLNCVSSLATVASGLSSRLRPGGLLIASVIGRYCPWEVARYACKGDLRRIAMRFSRELVAVPLGAGTVWTRYYSPAEFDRAFVSAGFERTGLQGLGVFLPPPYMHEAARRHPRITAVLHALENHTSRWPLLRACGDHFLVTLRRY